MSTLFDVKKTTLHDLLCNSREIYQIKNSKKKYSGNKKDWDILFNDLMRFPNSKDKIIEHIIVKAKQEISLGRLILEIIDGDHTITTLMILLSVFRDNVKQINNSLANYINDHLLFSRHIEDYCESITPKLKLGELDDDIFQRILKNEINGGNHLLLECYKFFQCKTFEEKLWKTMLFNIFFIRITNFSEVNLSNFFHLLSNQNFGTSSITTIKSFLIRKLINNPKIFEKGSNEWQKMEKKLEQRNFEQYFQIYIHSRFSRKIPITILDNWIKEEFRNRNQEDIVNLISDMNRKASIYNSIKDRNFRDRKINDYLYLFKVIKVQRIYPLLLNILYYYQICLLSKDEILYIFSMIETLHIRHGIINPKDLNLDKIHERISIEFSKLEPKEMLSRIYIILSSEFEKSLNNLNFKKEFATKSFKPSNKRTKYILWKLSNPSGETLLNFDEIQTEHIMPKNLSQSWIDYIKENDENKKLCTHSQDNSLINRIGNLTLLKGSVNRQISRKMFSKKKIQYLKSELKITKELGIYNKWGITEIEERSYLLSKKALKIWKWRYPTKYHSSYHK